MSVALAIFVKTPGLSPVKTRLGASIGKKLAEEFYVRSLKATSALAHNLKVSIPNLEIYWAVAEEEGIKVEYWKDFKVVSQGTGSLGERLSFVYNKLLSHHDAVFFIGADSPHLDCLKLSDGINYFCKNKFMIGETDDGGFYLFGGNLPISKTIWTSVKYSDESTCVDLCQKLKVLGEIIFIDKSFDIDQFDDLFKYYGPHFSIKNLLPEQLDVIEWTKNIYAGLKK